MRAKRLVAKDSLHGMRSSGSSAFVFLGQCLKFLNYTNLENIRNLNECKKEKNMKKEYWKLILQVIISVLTALGTTVGITSCG